MESVVNVNVSKYYYYYYYVKPYCKETTEKLRKKEEMKINLKRNKKNLVLVKTKSDKKKL